MKRTTRWIMRNVGQLAVGLAISAAALVGFLWLTLIVLCLFAPEG